MKRTLSDLDPIPENTDGAVRMPMLKRAQTDLGVSHPRVAEVSIMHIKFVENAPLIINVQWFKFKFRW